MNNAVHTITSRDSAKSCDILIRNTEISEEFHLQFLPQIDSLIYIGKRTHCSFFSSSYIATTRWFQIIYYGNIHARNLQLLVVFRIPKLNTRDTVERSFVAFDTDVKWADSVVRHLITYQ